MVLLERELAIALTPLLVTREPECTSLTKENNILQIKIPESESEVRLVLVLSHSAMYIQSSSSVPLYLIS